MRTRARTWIAALAASVALALAGCSAPGGFDHGDASPGDRRIPSADRFDPGFIVSDDAFFDARAMTEAESRTSSSSATAGPWTTCRASTTTPRTSPTCPPPDPCTAPRSRATTACPRAGSSPRSPRRDISPRTFLVLLQKEQSLLTRPSARGYERATGYGCPTPPTATPATSASSTRYRAGWQFRQVSPSPTGSSRSAASTCPSNRMPRAAVDRADPQPGHREPLQLHALPAQRRRARGPVGRRRLFGLRQPQLLATGTAGSATAGGAPAGVLPAVLAARRRLPVPAGRSARAGRAWVTPLPSI